ncbi:MAG: exodeoxyribonuclease III [Alphaproteobacteria bacterium]|nr:exodeoxyribonuclease III [Alphaproteobacteria bacterium]
MSRKRTHKIRIITWNINSVRLRVGLAVKILKKYQPNILCLQEIKCQNDEFPQKQFHKLGYQHIALNGIKAYHGVATISNLPIANERIIEFGGLADGRHIETEYKLGTQDLSLHNFYVPAGGDDPDWTVNEKFAYKLAFLDAMTAYFKKARNKKTALRVLVGDLNTAPFEHDVWSSKQLQNVISHTPIEREKLAKLQAAHKWDDIARDFVPPSEKLYSWWSYRARDWASSDRGRRLDHIWTSPALNGKVKHFDIIRTARGWKQPSDHVPVLADLQI